MGVRINHKACNASSCTLCLTTCHRKVFGRFPLDRQKNKLSTKFKTEIVFAEYCEDGCNKCETVCPNKAIKIDPKLRTKDMANDILLKVVFKMKFVIAKFLFKKLVERKPAK